MQWVICAQLIGTKCSLAHTVQILTSQARHPLFTTRHAPLYAITGMGSILQKSQMRDSIFYLTQWIIYTFIHY